MPLSSQVLEVIRRSGLNEHDMEDAFRRLGRNDNDVAAVGWIQQEAIRAGGSIGGAVATILRKAERGEGIKAEHVAEEAKAAEGTVNDNVSITADPARAKREGLL